MRLIQKIWNKFKTQPDEWFFYGFLLTLPLSIRKVLAFYQINGQFNEYTGIYLYLSDIFLALTIISWLFPILYNKYPNLSIFNNIPRLPRESKMLHACPGKTKCSTWNILDFFGVEQFGFFRGRTIFIPLTLVTWSFISILWSENQALALFRSIKLFELYLLFIYITAIVPRGTIILNSLYIIILIGLVNSTIGIWQFVIRHSVGLFWLKESLISPEIAGVAKIIFDGERFIRAYGLFPHPNILGGFILFSAICTWLYHQLFHVEHKNETVKQNCSTWNKFLSIPSKRIAPRLPRENKLFHVEQFVFLRGGTILKITLFIQIIALILTFSKSAALGLMIAIGYIIYKLNVPRGTNILNSITCVVSQNIKKIILIALISLVFIFIAKPDTSKWLFQSLEERLLYINVSRGTILDHPVFGIGAGQFVSDMQKYTQSELEIWQFQPVHNIFLLIWGELGVIGLLIFIIFLYKLFHVEQIAYKKCFTWNKYQADPTKFVPRGTNKITKIMSRGIMLGFLFIMLFDHYLWDIQQGELLLWITLGFLVGTAFPADNLSIDK